jgi:hypothetical protein
VSADASYLCQPQAGKVGEVQKELRESFTRTKRNFSAETPNRAAKKDQKYVLKEGVYLLTLARDIFVDDVDEEEVESDEVVDGQF